MLEDLSDVETVLYTNIGNLCIAPIRAEARPMAHLQVPSEFMENQAFVDVLVSMLDTGPRGDPAVEVFGYVCDYFITDGSSFIDLIYCKYDWVIEVFHSSTRNLDYDVRHATMGLLFGYAPSTIDEYLSGPDEFGTGLYKMADLYTFNAESPEWCFHGVHDEQRKLEDVIHKEDGDYTKACDELNVSESD